MTKLLLIDGHSQFYRAIFSPGPRLTAPDGEPTNGTYYYTRMLLSVLRVRHPTHVAVAIDGPRKDLERRRLFPAYKANRDNRKPDPAIFAQVDRMIEITRRLGLMVVRGIGWEADDVLATLVRKYKKHVDRTEVVSRDRDLHQLVSNKFNVCLYDPQSDMTTGVTAVRLMWGVPPKQVVEIKTLIGDGGDNVPGVGGVGPKRAKDLIAKFGTAQAVHENALQLPLGIRRNILRADMNLQRALVGLNSRVDLDPEPKGLDALKYNGPDFKATRSIFAKLGFLRLAAAGE